MIIYFRVGEFMNKKFKEILEREEKKKRKPIDKTFYYSEEKLKKKINEEEQISMILNSKR